MKKNIVINGKETNYEITSEGQIFNRKTGRELKGTKTRNEYISVQLSIDKKPKTYMVHRLVAEYFCDNPKGYNIVDHIDRNKYNNNYTNLRWVDSSTNARNTSCSLKDEENYVEFIDENWVALKHSDNYLIHPSGKLIKKNTRRIIKGSLRNDYVRVNLPCGVKSLHVLMWETFKGEIPKGMVIDHIDGNRSNNNLNNLRMVTQSENMKNAYKLNHKGQISVSQYNLKGEFIAKYLSFRKAAEAISGSEYAIKQAADRGGTSKGFFWIREDKQYDIKELVKKKYV